MTVWSTREVSCPVCSTRARLRLVGGGVAMGQDSDLFVRMAHRHVIQVEIHTCPRCRFSGYPDDFLHDLPAVRRIRFLKETSPLLTDGRLRPKLPAPGEVATLADANTGRPRRAGGRSLTRTTPLPDLQYYWAYKTAAALSLPPLEQGARLLRAYWCLRIPPSSALPRECRERRGRIYLRGAIRAFRNALSVHPPPYLPYLVGELCRRNGNFRLAVTHLQRFLQSGKGPETLRRAAAPLISAARERNAAGFAMEELV